MSDDTAIRSAAHHYMQRGLAIIALYGVREDGVTCQCGSAEHIGPATSAGKHPIGNDWGSRVLKDAYDETALPPGSNIGLKTGHASGVFALDVDPKNGGDARLRELIAEHGELPYTWEQRTGSGGVHFLFSLPEDFTPTNSRGRLPVGLDIRGEGGQIVLAPSVSAVGSYLARAGVAVPFAPAPEWLLELIRPLPPIEVPQGMESAYNPGTPTDRGAAYALAAVQAELAQLDQAVPGSRNHTAFNTACRLIELSNAPWSGLSEAAAVSWYAQAGRSIIDASFTERELWRCWDSAARRVRDKAAVLPPPPGGLPASLGWGDLGGAGVAPPFSSNGGANGSATPVPAPAGIPAQRDPFEDALPHSMPYVPGGQQVASPPPSPAGTSSPVTGLRALMLPRSQIARIPRPAPLIQGVLWRDTDTWLIGASGSGKSFVALDWAAHVSAGRQWNGRRTYAGRVLYLAAEGAAGIQQRLDAWEMAQVRAVRRAAESGVILPAAQPIPDELIVLPVAVQAIVRGAGRGFDRSPVWRELEGEVDLMRPALIVLDTQARLSLGLNENDNAEMGMFIEAVASLRRAAGGACMVVVHHTGRNGSDARGASAIDGAQDVEWKVVRAEGKMAGELKLDKNKNGPDGIKIPFVLQVQKLGYDQDTAEELTSLSVSYDVFDQSAAGTEPEHRTLALQVQALVLEVLREGSLTSGATKAEIRRKVNALCADRGLAPVKERTLDYAIDQPDPGRSPGLLQKEMIVAVGKSFVERERYDMSLRGYGE